MKELRGISVSPGIIVGKAFLYLDDKPQVPHYTVTTLQIDSEIARFHSARDRAVSDVESLRSGTSENMGSDGRRFLDAHLLMLADPEFGAQVEVKVREERTNAEWAMYEVVGVMVEQLEASEDQYLRERAIDIHDVARRILNHLLEREKVSLAELSEEVVLVTRNLLPSDTLLMNKRMVKAIAMDGGAKTSHTAILARSFEIAAVLGLSDVTRNVRTGDEIIIDGNAGVVIVDPDAETRSRYLRLSKEWHKRRAKLLVLNKLSAETRDGKLIRLKANIEVPEETEGALAHGADGIGLYRSEFLFLKPGDFPSEQVQYEAYSRVIDAMRGGPVTIRTLDLGGDKILPDLPLYGEKNPILGWRAVRFCLSEVELFKVQLRALLRASTHGDLRIMFPMISGVEELGRVLAVLEESKEELRKKGVAFNEKMRIGIMIEIPSAALTADILARRVDFFSIGTNDLIQYTIAVDRGNERIAYLYEPFHPGVLRLIKTIIEHAHAANIPVSMCGEMAGDPLATVVLLGLGLDTFSMSASRIPEVKEIIRAVTMSEAVEMVDAIMGMESYADVDRHVREWMSGRFNLSPRS